MCNYVHLYNCEIMTFIIKNFKQKKLEKTYIWYKSSRRNINQMYDLLLNAINKRQNRKILKSGKVWRQFKNIQSINAHLIIVRGKVHIFFSKWKDIIESIMSVNGKVE